MATLQNERLAGLQMIDAATPGAFDRQAKIVRVCQFSVTTTAAYCEHVIHPVITFGPLCAQHGAWADRRFLCGKWLSVVR